MRVVDGNTLGEHLMRLTAPCRACGTPIQFEQGARLAITNGIRDQVVMCNTCGRVFTVHLNPRGMTLVADVTANFPSIVTAAQPPIVSERTTPAAVASTDTRFPRRVVAYLIDAVIFAVPTSVLLAMYTARGNPAPGGLVLLTSVGPLVYFAAFEASAWQATPGKRLMRLKVSDTGGQRISFGRAVARTAGKVLSFMSLGIGLLMALFTSRRQALHDLIAGTIVNVEGPGSRTNLGP